MNETGNKKPRSPEHHFEQAFDKDRLHAPLVPPGKGAVMQEILTSFQAESGVTFRAREGGAFHIFPPARFQGDNLERIGGYDMTRRSLEDIEFYIPGLGKRIDQERGKIVVLGNGLSDLPIDLASRFSSGQLSEPAVVVDLFDYEVLLSDLQNLAEQFTQKGESYPFSDDISTVKKIVGEIKAGNIKTQLYMVGLGKPPEAIQNASLIINTQGPALETLAEQVSFLKPGGVLALSEFDDRALSNIPVDSITVIPATNGQENAGVFIQKVYKLI